jgi:hypothetical protein
MPRGQLFKTDMLAKVYKLKTELYNENLENGKSWNEGSHYALNKVLDILNEYRE